LTQARGQDATHDDLVDDAFLDSRPLDRFFDNESTKPSCGQSAQGTAEGTDGRSASARNHYFTHEIHLRKGERIFLAPES